MVALPNFDPEPTEEPVLRIGPAPLAVAFVEPGREQHTRYEQPEYEGDVIAASVLEPRAHGGRPHVSKRHPVDAYFDGGADD